MVSVLPTEGKNSLSFKNFLNSMAVPFVVYADFECSLQPVNECVSEKVVTMHEHGPVAYAYYIKCSFDPNLDRFAIYTGKDASEQFLNSLIADAIMIYMNHLSIIKPLVMSDEEEEIFKNAVNCHICNKPLLGDRVRDHCHLKGSFRGAAHSRCNLTYSVPSFIPIFFHNFSRYDAHLFVRELSKIPGEIRVLPQNKELYISLSKFIYVDETKIELRFLDSFRFMPASLDTLSSSLEMKDLLSTKRIFPNDGRQLNLMRRKGVFPYEYLSSFDRLHDKALPPREMFFNSLTNSECSEEDYQHAQIVWETFRCQTLKDYMELYLKTDVLLLTDVFENFRTICMSIYSLDPAHYYTTPGLSWDAMLKSTEIELELFTDIDMQRFIQRGIRGGLVQCSQRYSKANHKYMNDYDKTAPSQYLWYLEANNLYGWAMSQYLPYGDFYWMSDEEIRTYNVFGANEESEYGYILEVDINYPVNLHDLHNDLPFCPSNHKPTALSSGEKLIADFSPKYKYPIHYRNLQQCIRNGLELSKIHRILRFKQSPWLKKYIDINTHHRTQAKTSFEKDFFKLLNNAVYGKTIENVENRKNIKLVCSWETMKKNSLGARALISKANFHSSAQVSENMYAIQMKRLYNLYNKPIYLGFCVLDLSKLKMYDFHYNYMLPKFQNKLSLNYMDTDSFIYSIRVNDLYADIREDVEMRFDTSEYPLELAEKYKIQRCNKKVLGMMKDENNGKIMTEFIGLRAKMYSLRTEDGGCVKKAKLHKLYTQKITKVALSADDVKRFIKSDNINTYAWGHYKIVN